MNWSPRRVPLRWAVLLAFLVPLVAGGCGGPGSVSGKVSYRGQPLRGGNVTFISAEGGHTVSASIKEDGSYLVPRVPPGKAKVCVETESLSPVGKMRFTRYRPPAGAQVPKGLDSDSAAAPAASYVPIPPKYARPEESPLSCEVRSGSQNYDIDLAP